MMTLEGKNWKAEAKIIFIYSAPPLLCNSGFCHFSLWNLDQIWNPMTVLKSACHEDFKTPPTCSIWWSFGWDLTLSLQSYKNDDFGRGGAFRVKYTINDSVRILMTSRFQNCPWSLNLMKKWLRYSRLKTRFPFQRSNKSWDEIKFWSGIICL